jgi:3-hydroxymyristoyl/3-hydroxydecanoyl-(acyl carrier protein) dehydratase
MKRETILAGPGVADLLVPQRRPLSLLDCVVAWDEKPRPTIRAARHISSNEQVLAGHFPELAVWPGCFTIEGLAQSCRALSTLERLAEARERSAVVTALRNLERWLRREPGYDAEAARQTSADLRELQGPGLLVAVEIRLTRPVWPGCRLDYRVALERRMEDLVRFEVEASVSSEIVAHGTLTTARGPR